MPLTLLRLALDLCNLRVNVKHDIYGKGNKEIWNISLQAVIRKWVGYTIPSHPETKNFPQNPRVDFKIRSRTFNVYCFLTSHTREHTPTLFPIFEDFHG